MNEADVNEQLTKANRLLWQAFVDDDGNRIQKFSQIVWTLSDLCAKFALIN